MFSAEIHSAISQSRPALKQYHQLVHGLNSLLVWFQHLVWSADGAVCEDINTMSDRIQKMVGLGGLFSPPPGTFWNRRGKKASPVRTVLVWCRGGCGTGAKLVAAFAEVVKMSVRCIDDASYTKQPNKYY